MTSLYLDTSAILKRYLDEEFSQQCEEIITQYQDKYISRIGVTETLINLRKRLSAQEFAMAAKLFRTDIATFNIIEFDGPSSDLAVEIAQGSNLATVDAIHIAAAISVGGKKIDFLTYDKNQRKAAKSLGLRTP